MGTSFIYVVV